MKTVHFPPVILIIFLLSFVYWVYFDFRWSFSVDIIGYKELGNILYHQGLIGYVASGLHREPLYPLLCALAMSIENLSGVSFAHIMAGFSVLILMVSQVLIYIILRVLNIHTWICSLTLLYWAMSNIITSSAFNIGPFCEIVTYPLILTIIIAGHYGWATVKGHNNKASCCWGAVTGIMFTAMTLVKAFFECICPVYLIVFLAAYLFKNKISTSLVCYLAVAAVLFYCPIIGYKFLNKAHNGNFAVTDRGPVIFYGNVMRRTDTMTLRKYLADLALVPGEAVCRNYFNPQECYYWTFNVSDDIGNRKTSALMSKHLSSQAISETLFHDATVKIVKNLPQYFILTVIEGLKAFFWGEQNFIGGILSCLAILYCFFSFNRLPAMMGHVLIVIFLYILVSSFGCVLQRYLLPIVPLYLIAISYTVYSFFAENKVHNSVSILN